MLATTALPDGFQRRFRQLLFQNRLSRRLFDMEGKGIEGLLQQLAVVLHRAYSLVNGMKVRKVGESRPTPHLVALAAQQRPFQLLPLAQDALRSHFQLLWHWRAPNDAGTFSRRQRKTR